MKKVEKVSIAGISFTLDDDAYAALKQYLDSLRSYYSDDPDGGEIISDIEGRIAELILEEQVYTKIVSRPLVDTIVAQLGSAEEIDDDTEVAGAPGGWATAPAETASIPRRLYRAREGRIFGGVCAGIANYHNISVAWIRLIFLIPVLLWCISLPDHLHWLKGFGEGLGSVFLVTYLVLWFAMPLAKTPRQRLEARGERITPSSIRHNLVSRARSSSNPNAPKAASVLAEVSIVLGRIVLFFVKFVSAIVGFTLLFSALGLFIGMIVIVSNPHIAIEELISALSMIDQMPMPLHSPLWLMELVLLCWALPLTVLGVMFVSFAFSWKIRRSIYGSLLVVWGVAMVGLAVVLINNATYATYLRDRHRIEIRSDFDSDPWRSNTGGVPIRRLDEDADAVFGPDSLALDSLSRETLTPLN